MKTGSHMKKDYKKLLEHSEVSNAKAVKLAIRGGQATF